MAHYHDAAGIALISLTNAISNSSANGRKKQPDSALNTGSIEADGLDWFQQFMKHLEFNWSSVSQRIAKNNDQSAYRLEVLRAVKLTLKDSGMDESSIQTSFAQVAFEGTGRIRWN